MEQNRLESFRSENMSEEEQMEHIKHQLSEALAIIQERGVNHLEGFIIALKWDVVNDGRVTVAAAGPVHKLIDLITDISTQVFTSAHD